MTDYNIAVHVATCYTSCPGLSGGLQNALPDRQREGGIVMAGPDSFGLPPRRLPGSILRRQVTPHFHPGFVIVLCGHNYLHDDNMSSHR